MDLFGKLKEMTILLIDDDEWIRNSLSLFFTGEGCRLLALETAEEAVEAIKQRDYDIMIVDHKLPGMDGLEFLRHVQESHPDAVKILITAYGNEEVASKARKMGIDDFIEKPFTSTIIEESLSRVIKNRKEENRLPSGSPRHKKQEGERDEEQSELTDPAAV
jgi:DNA-binding NtrC family response regulator